MKFRKKPVVIEAEQFWPDSKALPFHRQHVCALDGEGWYIRTLESERFTLTPGDWVIKGVKGEFYACKPDIFEQLYDQEED